MKVPLDVIVDDRHILMVKNRTVDFVRRPFRPFLITEHDGTDGKELFELFERRNVNLVKRSFDSVSDCRGFESNWDKGIYAPSYSDQLSIFGTKFIRNNPSEGDLVVLALDIEVRSSGSTFPNADRDPILCIGTKIEDEVKIFGRGMKVMDRENERAMLLEFSEYLKSVNPDIILTYNGKEFDLPYIYTRCEMYGISPNLRRIESTTDDEAPACCGRVHIDLFDSVLKDQSLYGIPNKKMKTMAEEFGMEGVIELPPEEIANTAKVFAENPEKLWKYLESDVDITWQLGGIYLPNHIALAEMVEVPLNYIVDGPPSFLPKITHARELLRRNKIFLSRNCDRYPLLEESKFEAAYVDIFQKGRFDKVWKVDFTSMYPSSMITLNLSPETTRIVDFADFTGKEEFVRSGDTLLLRIPDNNFRKDVLIQVDMGKTGFIKENLLRYRELRSSLKKQMKDAGTEAERQNLKSRQVAIKVLSNTVFGYSGSAFGQFSDLSIAIAVVGTCRWLTKSVIDWIEEE